MTILLRKFKRHAVALLRTDTRLIGTAAGRHPSLLQTVFALVLALLPAIALLLLATVWLSSGSGHDGLTLAIGPLFVLKAKREKLAKDANAALAIVQAKAKAENRSLTPEELAADDTFNAQIAAVDQEIELEERKAKRERMIAAPAAEPAPRADIRDVRDRAEDDPQRGFRSHRDFLRSVMAAAGIRDRTDVEDERLRPLAIFDKEDRQAGGELAFLLPVAYTPGSIRATVGSDEQSANSDPYGGFAVGRTLIPRMLSVGNEGDPTEGRTQDLPMQTVAVDIPARTDKNHTSSVTGGFTFSRKAETAAAAASRMSMEMVKLKAASLFGLAYATEELLSDSLMSFIAIIDSGFRDQLPAHMLNEKIRGLGDSEFLGVLNSDATVSQAKENAQTAATISHPNVTKMRSRCWGYGKAIWIANHDTYPQLSSLSVVIGTSGALVYQQSVVEDRPDMLLGRPIFYSEFCEAVGTVGDIILGNWSQYLEGLYQPLQSAESVHVRFVNHERAFKVWLRNAGSPWWRSALTPKKSSITMSPFVTLATRS